MSIADRFNIIFGWYDEDPKAFSGLEAQARNGDRDAEADLYAIRAETSEDAAVVTEQTAALEKLAASGCERAQLMLGILYHEGLDELLPCDMRKSDAWLNKAAAAAFAAAHSGSSCTDSDELTKDSVYALYTLCMHSWFRCSVFVDKPNDAASAEESAADNEQAVKDTLECGFEPATAQDFLNAERQQLALFKLRTNKQLPEQVRSFIVEIAQITAGWLPSIYESPSPVSPVYSPEKAQKQHELEEAVAREERREAGIDEAEHQETIQKKTEELRKLLQQRKGRPEES